MPGSPLNLDVPTTGDTWATWSSKAEAAFEAIEADLEPPVLFSELSANANFDLANFGSTNARYYNCYPGNSTTIPTNGIGVKNGEWYATDGSGNEVQITSNGTLNFAATGGFTGEYVSAGAQAKYTNATTLYEFLDGAGALADVSVDDLRVGNGANYVALGYGGSVNTAFTFPATAAAGVSVLTIDASGVVAHNGTIGVGFTVNNANITFTGTADLKHPDHTYTVAADNHNYFVNSGVAPTAGRDGRHTHTGTPDIYYRCPPYLCRVGARLKSVVLGVNKTNGLSTITVRVYKGAAAGSNMNPGDEIASNTITAIGEGTVTVTVGAPAALVAGEHWVTQVSGVVAADIVRQLRWVIDRT